MEKSGSMRLVSSVLLVLMLLMAIGMGPNSMVAEARKAGRTCEVKSQKFSGMCFSGSNCANICKTEGLSGGNCRGFRRRCFCTRGC